MKVLCSAFRHYSRREVMYVLAYPRNIRDHYPDPDRTTIVGFTQGGVPLVLLQDMRTGAVYHAQRAERKHGHLFR